MFSISFIARETGISAATLRKWEQRYGFPIPSRTINSIRYYNEQDLALLQQVKRQLDQGERPGKLLKNYVNAVTLPSAEAVIEDEFIQQALVMLTAHQMKTLQNALAKKLKKLGVVKFVEQVAEPLTRTVGEKWAEGVISVFTEHCYSQQMYALLTNFASFKNDCYESPRILLATLPGEKHILGLAMAQAILFSEQACCINLGAELPILEFSKAATDYQADIVGVSFSLAFPKRNIFSALTQLRAALNPAISIWIGGSGVKQIANLPDGVDSLYSPAEIVAAINAYKVHQQNHYEKKSS